MSRRCDSIQDWMVKEDTSCWCSTLQLCSQGPADFHLITLWRRTFTPSTLALNVNAGLHFHFNQHREIKMLLRDQCGITAAVISCWRLPDLHSAKLALINIIIARSVLFRGDSSKTSNVLEPSATFAWHFSKENAINSQETSIALVFLQHSGL